MVAASALKSPWVNGPADKDIILAEVIGFSHQEEAGLLLYSGIGDNLFVGFLVIWFDDKVHSIQSLRNTGFQLRSRREEDLVMPPGNPPKGYIRVREIWTEEGAAMYQLKPQQNSFTGFVFPVFSFFRKKPTWT